MLDEELLEHVADFYGSFTLDELAERLGLETVEVIYELEYWIEQRLDGLEEEMGYSYNIDEDEDEEED